MLFIVIKHKYQASNGPQFGKQQLLRPCALDQSSHTIRRLNDEAIPLKLLWSMVEVYVLSIAKRNVDALSKLHNQIATLLQVLFYFVSPSIPRGLSAS